VRHVIEILAAVSRARLFLPPGARLRLPAVIYLIRLAALVGVTARGASLANPIAPDISRWAGTLENKLKGGCCASADGWKPEAVEYDIAADHYRVRIEGEWHDGPADAVLNGPNTFGFAVVWYCRTDLNGERSMVHIRCFLPGAGG
jgi:hypothetical protein